MGNIFHNLRIRYRYFIPIICKYKKKYLMTILLNAISVAINISIPYMIGKLTNSLLNKSFAQLKLLVTITILFLIVDIISSYSKSVIESILIFSLINDLNKLLFKKILNLNVINFEKSSIGDFISRICIDNPKILITVTQSLVTIVLELIKIIVIAYITIKYDLLISIIIFSCMPIMFLATRKIRSNIKYESIKLISYQEKFYSYTYENFMAIKEIKSLNLYDECYKKFNDFSDNIKNQNIEVNLIKNKSSILTRIIIISNLIMILIVGAILIVNNSLSLAKFISIMMYVYILNSSIKRLADLFVEYEEVIVSIDRINEILDISTGVNNNNKIDCLRKFQGAIEFKNIKFRYDNRNSVLKNVDFKIEPKSKVAIIGKSGEGKTTIFNLLLKLYKPSSGEIKFDDIDIENFSELEIRNNITIVSQKPFLFNISILDNLRIVKPNASIQEIEEVCKKAYINDFIQNLPEKYDTIIGSNGINLSVGQIQRLAIARGILKSSSILLLDEATSSLDNESQYFIKKIIDDLSKEKTVIIIAHRLSTILNSDKILLINDGVITEQGNHKELYESSVIYRSLYDMELRLQG